MAAEGGPCGLPRVCPREPGVSLSSTSLLSSADPSEGMPVSATSPGLPSLRPKGGLVCCWATTLRQPQRSQLVCFCKEDPHQE